MSRPTRRRGPLLLLLLAWSLQLNHQSSGGSSSILVHAFTTPANVDHLVRLSSRRRYQRQQHFLISSGGRPSQLEEEVQCRAAPLAEIAVVEASRAKSGWISRIGSKFSSMVTTNKGQLAKVGVSFAVTYNVVSNINGSVFFSLAWYIASRQVRKRKNL